jgi:pilus assembly protein CpaE
MARLVGVIVSEDEAFRKQIGTMLRTSRVPVNVSADAARQNRRADLLVLDGRHDLASAMSALEGQKAASPAPAIFVVARESTPELILQAMRAGANEFFTFPPAADAFQEALTRTAARRTAAAPERTQASTIVFFGAKGGAGTTTVAVNCGVELARLSKRRTVVVDLKPGLGEVALFLGIRSRYSLLDALDNVQRLDAQFLKELVVTHKSGLEIIAGSDHFDRPGPSDTPGLEEVFRLLREEYEYVLVDAGSQITPASLAALYAADTIALVANPDVPSIRNAQRLLERIRQIGASPDRVRLLLNRAAEPFPIPPAQIEAAVGHPIDHSFPSDYKTVSTALNSGVPLALTGNTDLAAQFDGFTRRILDDDDLAPVEAPLKKSATPLGLNRLASIW